MKNQIRIVILLGASFVLTVAARVTVLPAGEPGNPEDVRAARFDEPVATTGSALIDEVLSEQASGGRGILDVTEIDRKVQEGMIKARVEKELSSARNEMGTNPDGAEQNL